MHSSIIIPTRNRNRNLGLCVWSIAHSAALCGVTEYEIIVVDSHSDVPPVSEGHTIVLGDTAAKGMFGKPRLQNIGIEAARGNVLSFLDADTLVGPRWMEGVLRLTADPTLTKLCYRVRYIPAQFGDSLDVAIDRSGLLDLWFDTYAKYTRAHEGYGRPEHNYPCPGPIFGNSQFSIRRDVLGDLRFNEEYVGRGFEDLWMNRAIWMRNPDAYRAEIVTAAEHAMFHIQNAGPDSPDWCDMRQNRRNKNLYEGSWSGMKKFLPVSRNKRRDV